MPVEKVDQILHTFSYDELRVVYSTAVPMRLNFSTLVDLRKSGSDQLWNSYELSNPSLPEWKKYKRLLKQIKLAWGDLYATIKNLKEAKAGKKASEQHN